MEFERNDSDLEITACSLLNNDFVITGEVAEEFLKNVENPDPKRVEIRKKTLLRARDFFQESQDCQID